MSFIVNENSSIVLVYNNFETFLVTRKYIKIYDGDNA